MGNTYAQLKNQYIFKNQITFSVLFNEHGEDEKHYLKQNYLLLYLLLEIKNNLRWTILFFNRP